VRAPDVAGLVLHPDPALGGEPEPIRELVRANERGGQEAPAIDLGHRLVQRLHQVDEAAVGHPVTQAEVVGVEQLSVPDVRVGLVALREPDVGGIELPNEDVIDVVARPDVRAAEGVGLVGGHDEATPRAHDGGDVPGHGLTPPRRGRCGR
jgi:hypothetical protein